MGEAVLARRRRLWAATSGLLNVAYAAAIWFLAMMPTPPHVAARDWLLHAIAFGVQAILLHGLLRSLLPRVRSLLAASAAAIAYGTLIEVLQLAVPGRFCELRDLVANAVGVAVSIALLAVWEPRRGALREVSG